MFGYGGVFFLYILDGVIWWFFALHNPELIEMFVYLLD